MRSVEEIQQEISEVEAELARARAEMTQMMDQVTDEQREQDSDPEWRVARQRYIDDGDVGGIQGWYNRRDERRRIANEEAQARASKASGNEDAKKKLERAVREAQQTHADFVSTHDMNYLSADEKERELAYRRAYERAVQEYKDSFPDSSQFADALSDPFAAKAPAVGEGQATGLSKKDYNSLEASIADLENGKGTIPDSVLQELQARAEQYRDDPDYVKEGQGLLNRLVKLGARAQSKVDAGDKAKLDSFNAINQGGSRVANMNRWKEWKKKYPKDAEKYDFKDGVVVKKAGM